MCLFTTPVKIKILYLLYSQYRWIFKLPHLERLSTVCISVCLIVKRLWSSYSFYVCSRFAAEHSPALLINLRKSNRILWQACTCGGIYVLLHVNMEYDNKKHHNLIHLWWKSKLMIVRGLQGSCSTWVVLYGSKNTGNYGSCYIFSSLKPECSYNLMFLCSLRSAWSCVCTWHTNMKMFVIVSAYQIIIGE